MIYIFELNDKTLSFYNLVPFSYGLILPCLVYLINTNLNLILKCLSHSQA